MQIPLACLDEDEFISKAEVAVVESVVEVTIEKSVDNLVVSLALGGMVENEASSIVLVHGKYSWLMEGEIHTKTIKSVRKNLEADNSS